MSKIENVDTPFGTVPVSTGQPVDPNIPSELNKFHDEVYKVITSLTSVGNIKFTHDKKHHQTKVTDGKGNELIIMVREVK